MVMLPLRPLPLRTIYSPLDPVENAIRLIRLCARKDSDPDAENLIRCELYHALRDDTLQYAALSYTWGDPAETVPIIVNNTPVDVPQNLHSALGHIRGDEN